MAPNVEVDESRNAWNGGDSSEGTEVTAQPILGLTTEIGKTITVLCRRKMRMSGLCKVEMSAYMDGRGRHGDGANGLESTGTGPHTAVA